MSILRRTHGVATAWGASQPIPFSTAATVGDDCFLVALNVAAVGPAPTDWTEVAVGAGGGYNGKVFHRKYPASAPAQPTVTASGGAGGVAFIEHWYTDAVGMVLGFAAQIASDNDTSSTAFSAAGSSIATLAGDILLVALALKAAATQTAGPSSIVVTQAGATMGTQVGNFGTRLGTASPTNSLHYGTYHRPVTTGATDAPSMTAVSGTGGGNAGGLAALIRLREVASNAPPTANAGPDQTGIEPWSTVTLTGLSSGDSDGTIASYAWTQTAGTAVTLSSSSAAQPTFTAPPTLDGETLTFSLVVTDNAGAPSTADTVNIAVLPATEFVRSAGGIWLPRRPAKRSAGAWV